MKTVENEQELTATVNRRFRKESRFALLMKQWDYQIMILPSLLFILIFSYIPMWGVLVAFKEYNLFTGFQASPWVGMLHFRMFFESPEFWEIMRNTICISLLKLFVGFPAPIVLALMLNEVTHTWFKRVVQTITYIPHFLSWVVVSAFVFSMLAVDNGLGMSQDTLDQIFNVNGTSIGYGIGNVNERIKLHFGKGYGVAMHSEVGSGTTVRITLPKHRLEASSALASKKDKELL